MKIRESVLFFAAEMDKKLRENDHKGDWLDLPLDYLMNRLYQGVNELFHSIRQGDNKNSIKEAADVGNFAMMIADIIYRKEYPDQANWREINFDAPPPSWEEVAENTEVEKTIRTAKAEALTTPVNLNKAKTEEYRQRFGKHRGHYKWDLAISFLSLDNQKFFDLYGFNYVPERQITELARLHLSNREAIQAAKLSESMFNNITVDTLDDMAKKMLNELRNSNLNNSDK